MKTQVLLVGRNESWLATFREALAGSNVEIQVNLEPHELGTQRYANTPDLVIADLALDGTISENDVDSDGTHDALEAILAVGKRHPQTKLIVVGEMIGREALQSIPGLPRPLFFLPREQFDAEKFKQALNLLLQSESVAMQSSFFLRPLGNLSQQWQALPPMPEVGSRPGKPRMLIVEDQPFWQDILARIMHDEQYFWRIAATLDQAMSRLQLESFHLILLNLALGGAESRDRQGWQLLDYVVNRSPKTRIVVVSGQMSSSEVARLFMSYPIKGFVDKNTFNRNELLSLVKELVSAPSLKIQTLGDFRIMRDGKLVNHFAQPQAEVAIKFLLTRAGATVSADELIQYLWPGEDRRSRYSTLTEVINAARAALEPDLPRASDSRLILRDGSGFRLDLSANVEIDSEQLKRQVERARQHEMQSETDQALGIYKAVQGIYQGDYLPGDRALPWTTQERTAIQVLYTESLNRMADIYARRGEIDQAIRAANLALRTDPYVEGTYRRLMRYHYCKGDRTAALGVYRALQKLFSEFIAEELSSLTRELYEDIEEGRPVECVEMTSGAWRMPTDRERE